MSTSVPWSLLRGFLHSPRSQELVLVRSFSSLKIFPMQMVKWVNPACWSLAAADGGGGGGGHPRHDGEEQGTYASMLMSGVWDLYKGHEVPGVRLPVAMGSLNGAARPTPRLPCALRNVSLPRAFSWRC